MTLLYRSESFLDHETGNHPERAMRLRRIYDRLADEELGKRCTCPEWDAVSTPRLTRVHGAAYQQRVEQFAKDGGGRIDADTVVCPKSFDVALRAAGAVCDATERVLKGDDVNALCLVRPPGHHALPNDAMGFCLFNNVAIAARVATQELDVDRVLIVDWDVHHGNGTQDAFWRDPQVGFLSSHRWPFYPGTGAETETGEGPGLGNTMNLPVQFGTPRDDYLKLFASRLNDFATRVKPELILISAGFDSHRQDPIGSIGLETEDFGTLTATVMELAESHCAGKIVSVLEGGYNVNILPDCVATHLELLLGD